MKATSNATNFFSADAWKGESLTLAIMRMTTGIFLVHGVLDNIVDAKRMQEFAQFMRASGFAAADFWAPFSVYTQLLAGILLVAGVGVRIAGAIIAVTFLVGLFMVHWSQGLREWWPALALVVIGLHFITRGAGELSLDGYIARTLDSQRR